MWHCFYFLILIFTIIFALNLYLLPLFLPLALCPLPFLVL